MAQTDRILKVDKAGRVWTPREQRETVLDEFERSGLPATKFAAHIGVKYPTFASWVQKRRKRRGDGVARSRRKEPGALKWLEATVDEALRAKPSYPNNSLARRRSSWSCRARTNCCAKRSMR